MSRPWGKIGAWAAEAEREEEEEKKREAALASVAPPSSFPSLKESVKQQPHNQKKKKMTLSEFYAAGSDGGRKDTSSSKGLTPDEMMRLPTGPKERSEDEMGYGRLGGGFGGYGGGGGGGRRDGGQEGAWGGGNRRSYGGDFDEDRRGGRGEGSMMQSRVSEFEPSRADVVDDWGSGKRVFPVGNAGDRSNRYGSLGGGGRVGDGIGQSRADDVNNWAAGKKPVTPASARSSTFGAGYRDSGPAPDSGRWERGGGSFRENNNVQERTRLVLEPRKESNVSIAAATGNKPSPFGAARPREEVLAEKGLDWKKLDSEIEAKTLSRPTSSQSSRPNSAQSSRSDKVNFQGGVDVAVKPKPKVNPFGDAKPREVLLEEKGKDWRKIDMELERRPNRLGTDEESLLKEEINRLKKELEKEPSSQETGSDAPNIQDKINQKEQELEQLARELDDKIRFGQKVSERPGSGAGRVAGFSNRPPSRTGSVDELKGTGFIERPRSRGAADVWSRPGGDERRSFQAGGERRILGSRDIDRKRTGDAW